MRILSFALSCLVLLGGVSCLGLELGQTLYQDPTADHDTQLQLEVHHTCVSNIIVTVHVPNITDPFNHANTGHYVGSPFDDQVINVGSKYSPGAGKTIPLTVSWDGSNIFTFKNFIARRLSGERFDSTPANRWINLDVAIPDSALKFISLPVPLRLEFNSDYNHTQNETPVVTLSGKIHIQATATNDPCQDAPNVQGDPVFAGFQGQNFQFHGLPDEHFNLVSSPDVQLNSHFVYLSSGQCDYNDTPCFSHAGTYMDALGLAIADARVKVVAGTHAAGLRVWLNDEELTRGTHMRHITNNVTTSQLTYHHNGHLEVHTDILRLEIVNSDMFFNLRVGLNDRELLRVGAIKHTVTDHAICKTNSATNNYQLVEQIVAEKYDVNTSLHGLIGQTWRNVKVCGRDWMGTVEDYVVSDLFSSDSHFNYFNSQW